MKKNWIITIILVASLSFTVWFIQYTRTSLTNSLESGLPEVSFPSEQ